MIFALWLPPLKTDRSNSRGFPYASVPAVWLSVPSQYAPKASSLPLGNLAFSIQNRFLTCERYLAALPVQIRAWAMLKPFTKTVLGAAGELVSKLGGTAST